MKRHLLLMVVAFFCFIQNSNAQEWKKELKEIENPNFYEVQKVFNQYWNDKTVEQKKKKGSGYKQYKRFEWFWAPRVTKKGEFPANTVLNDEWQRFKETEIGSTSARTIEENSWTSLGPSTISSGSGGVGRINCIAFHPTDANTFWIGAPAGGLWKTTDGGTTWATSYDDEPILGVSDIAIHPTDPNIMYLATGDGDRAFSTQTFGASGGGDTKSLGIVKSTDGGSTWTNILTADVSSGVLIRRLIIDPEFPNYLYAATSLGIYVTDDAGATWSNVQQGYFMDIERHPTDDLIFYASSFGSDAQVYVSIDGGYNWSQTSSFTGISRINIEVSAAEPDMVGLLCVNLDGEGLHSLYSSSDKGQNWDMFYNAIGNENLLGWEIDGSDTKGQGTYDLAFAIDPTNANKMFVGGVTNWKTSDGGSNWKISNYWTDNEGWTGGADVVVAHADKHFLAYHPLNNSVLYECNDGGLWKTEDGGTTWINLTDGLVIGQFYDIDGSQADLDKIVGGFQDNGSKLRTSSGWAEASGGDGMGCQIDDQNGKFYTSYVNGVIYRATDGVNIDAVISENLPNGQLEGEWLTPFVLDPIDQSIIYAGYDEVYKSTDSGDSWTQQSNLGTGVNLKYLAIQPDNSDIIYAGIFNTVLISVDGGTNWTDITAGLPVSSVNISRIVPYGATGVLVTLSGYNATEKIYYSDDKGSTWTNATLTGLPNVPANCAAFDENEEDIYIGTDLGVFIFDDVAQSWSRYGADMPNVPITDLDIQYSAQKIRAATFGRGLWEADLSTISDVQAPEVSTYNPDNGSSGILISTDLTISFNETVVKGTGNITVKKSSDDSTIETIDVTSNNVTISASTVTITIEDLAFETQFYVLIDNTAFADASENGFAGISESATWSFTTEQAPDTTAPVVTSLTPSNSNENVAIDAGLIIEFDEEVEKGTGNIRIVQVTNQSTHETIDVTSSDVTVSGKTSTIDVNSNFDENTEYFVEIDAGTYKDLSGNNFDGISGSDLWKFITEIITAIDDTQFVDDRMLLHYQNNELKIKLKDELHNLSDLKIFDIKGQLMWTKDNVKNVQDEFVLNYTFKKGVYIVLVITENKIYKEKFVSID